MLREVEKAVAFMKASYSVKQCTPSIPLPPEILELVYMYCITGTMQVSEMRKLYPAAVLHGMKGLTDRDIIHRAVEKGQATILSLEKG